MLVVFTNLNHMEFQGRYLALFCLFSLIDSFEWFRMGSPHKNNPVNARVSYGSILGPTLFSQYVNDLPDDVICNIVIYTDDIALF